MMKSSARIFGPWTCSACGLVERDGNCSRCSLCHNPRSRRRDRTRITSPLRPPADESPGTTNSNRAPRSAVGAVDTTAVQHQQLQPAPSDDVPEPAVPTPTVPLSSNPPSPPSPSIVGETVVSTEPEAPTTGTHPQKDNVVPELAAQCSSTNDPKPENVNKITESQATSTTTTSATNAPTQSGNMLLRVRTNSGMWRVGNLALISTVQDVVDRIAAQYGKVTYAQPLSTDPACTAHMDPTKTLAEFGLQHGAMLHCRVGNGSTVAQASKVGMDVHNRNMSKMDANVIAAVKPTEEHQDTKGIKRDAPDDPAVIDLTDDGPEASPKRTRVKSSGEAVPLSPRSLSNLRTTLLQRCTPFTGMRINWQGEGDLDEFLQAVPPTQVSKDQCAWIAAQNIMSDSPGFESGNSGPPVDKTSFMPALDRLKAIVDQGGNIPAATKKACVDCILVTAQQQNCTAGKWMVFCKPAFADTTWENICRATSRGDLGSAAKIAPAKGADPDERILCCIYVKDFSNRLEVKRVLLALETIGIRVKSGFKPDIFTHLDINSDNEWRLKPTIYSVNEVMKWEGAV